MNENELNYVKMINAGQGFFYNNVSFNVGIPPMSGSNDRHNQDGSLPCAHVAPGTLLTVWVVPLTSYRLLPHKFAHKIQNNLLRPSWRRNRGRLIQSRWWPQRARPGLCCQDDRDPHQTSRARATSGHRSFRAGYSLEAPDSMDINQITNGADLETSPGSRLQGPPAVPNEPDQSWRLRKALGTSHPNHIS